MTKHRPVVGGNWKDVVKSTGARHGKAKYGPHPHITEAMIEKMEMETITEGTVWKRSSCRSSAWQESTRSSEFTFSSPVRAGRRRSISTRAREGVNPEAMQVNNSSWE